MPAYAVIDRNVAPRCAVTTGLHARVPVAPAEADMREQFVTAAEWVLATDGFAKFKVREVCKRANRSTHNFYAVFENKHELLAAMLEKQFSVAAGYLHRRIDPTLPPAERVWANVSAMLDFGFDRRLDMPLALYTTYWRTLVPLYQDLTERIVTTVLAPLQRALAEGEAAGLLCSPDPAADAKAIYHLLVALLFDRPVEPRREDVARIALDFITRALRLSDQKVVALAGSGAQIGNGRPATL